MDPQNLAYALTQVAHNFGAVAVVGGALLGRWPLAAPPPLRRRLAWLVLMGWLLQGLSGAGFGAISYAYYRQFPELHDIALVALLLKLVCAVVGVLLAAGYLRYQFAWSAGRLERSWTGLILLGITALTAAAFLRWFA
jgi:hypothetical protein